MAKGNSGLDTLVPSGYGADGDGPWTQNPDMSEPDTLRAALGEKGRPLGIERAAKGANPYYSYAYREFSENCQRAVIAYEARRRGYNVTARPTFEGDVLPRHAHTNTDGSVNAHWMGAFQNAKSIYVGAKDAQTVRDKIENNMKSFGNGSRAIIQVQWVGGGGHVFNIERRYGRTYWVDAQVGMRYNPNDVLRVVKTDKVNLVRTDNLRFSERAKKSVEPAGRRH